MEKTQQVQARCEVIPWDQCDSPRVAAAWQALSHVAVDAAIFSLPEWLHFASATGCLTQACLLQVTLGERTVGLLPLQRRGIGAGETIALLSQDYASMLIDPTAEESVFSAIAEWFSQQRKLHLLKVGPCGNARHQDYLIEACRQHGLATRTHTGAPSVWLQLPDSWDAYLAQLGQATRKSVRTAEKRLQRDFPELDFQILTESSAASHAALDDLIRLYRLRWGNQIGGSFLDDAQNRTFYRQVMSWALESGYASIPILRIDGQTMAVSTILRLPQQDFAFFHLIARETERLPSYYAPGIFINMQSIRWAIEQGIHAINIGSGKNEHKLQLGGTQETIWEMTIAHSTHALTVWPKVNRGVHITQRLPVHLWHYLRLAFGTRRKNGAR